MFRERDKLMGVRPQSQGNRRAPWILAFAVAALVAGIAFALLRRTSATSPTLDNGVSEAGAKPIDNSAASTQSLIEQANNQIADAQARAMNALDQAEREAKRR